MKNELVEAVRTFVRYETPDKNDQTRRERNEKFDTTSPSLVIPEAGQFLWDIFHKLHRSISRVSDGYYRMIPPSEFEAWCRLTGTLVYPTEYDILNAMDRTYCEEANMELDADRTRQSEESKRDTEGKMKRGG